MENYIPISFLNDFTFCPRSIYYHQLYNQYKKSTFQQKPQLAGKAAHKSIDTGNYTSRADVLMNHEIYVENYKLYGKIDIFDVNRGVLTERKRSVKTIYDGYVFQVYAHYFGLQELGFKVEKVRIHDLCANKNYPILLPTQDPHMFRKFEQIIYTINHYTINDPGFDVNPQKCQKCIYSQLCDKSEIC